MWSTRMKNQVNRWLSIARQFRIPGTCELCLTQAGAAGFLCDTCLQTLARAAHACAQCAEPMTQPGRCGRCQSSPPAFDYGYSSFLYQPPIAHWIQAAKDREQLVWLNRLAWLQAQHPPPTIHQADALIFIPAGRKKLLYRGYNPGELLTLRLGRLLNIPVLTDALEKTGGRDQRGLSAQDRKRNLRRSLRAGKRTFCGEHLLIIDDVLTTGATADAAARILKKQGAGITGVWSLSRTARN